MTPYEDIYKVFLGQISDPQYLNLGTEVLTDDMTMLLNEAIMNFEFPKVDLREKDDDMQEFGQTLNFDEVQILGYLMVQAWMRRELMDVDLLRQTMSPLEFQKYSQANHLNALMKLKQQNFDYIEMLKKRYSRRHNNKSLFHRLGGE